MNAKCLSTQRDQRAEQPRVLLGIGTGRCGTLALSRLLSDQPAVRVSHELTPVLPWNASNSRNVIASRLARLRASGDGCAIVGDIGFYYLNYVADAFHVDPTLKAICLRRPKREVVASYRRWISRNFGPNFNHWAGAEGCWQRDPLWWPCYPTYDVADMNLAIERYWEDYYATVEELRAEFPDRVGMWEMDEALNTRAGQQALLEFAGIAPAHQVLSVGKRSNANAGSTAAPPVVSIVVTCKGRLHHLRHTLPTMLNQQCPFEYEVIIVDYGCPEGTFDWCSSLNLRRLVSLRVTDGTELFNLSRARNCGGRIAVGKAIAFVDADMRMHPSWLSRAAGPVLEGRAGLSRVAQRGPLWDRCGTCVVSTDLFDQVRGYDEGFQGWGSEDSDFYARCMRIAPAAKYLPALLRPIQHDDQERVRYYGDASRQASHRRTNAYQRARSGGINACGYGVGRFEIFQGTQHAVPVVHWNARRRIRARIRRPCASARRT